MSTAKLLPELPLSVSHHGDSIIIVDATGSWIVGQCAGGRGETAAFIVRACNSHEELLAACKAMVAAFTAGTADQHTRRLAAIAAITKAEGKA